MILAFGRNGLGNRTFCRFRSLAVGLPAVGPCGRAGELAAFRSRNVSGKGIRSQLDVFCKNEAIFAKSQGPGQAVLQLAHVARPVVFLELAQGAAAEARRGQALGFRGPGQEKDGQKYAAVIYVVKYAEGEIKYTVGYDENMKLVQFVAQ